MRLPGDRKRRINRERLPLLVGESTAVIDVGIAVGIHVGERRRDRAHVTFDVALRDRNATPITPNEKARLLGRLGVRIGLVENDALQKFARRTWAIQGDVCGHEDRGLVAQRARRRRELRLPRRKQALQGRSSFCGRSEYGESRACEYGELRVGEQRGERTKSDGLRTIAAPTRCPPQRRSRRVILLEIAENPAERLGCGRHQRTTARLVGIAVVQGRQCLGEAEQRRVKREGRVRIARAPVGDVRTRKGAVERANELRPVTRHRLELRYAELAGSRRLRTWKNRQHTRIDGVGIRAACSDVAHPMKRSPVEVFAEYGRAESVAHHRVEVVAERRAGGLPRRIDARAGLSHEQRDGNTEHGD